MCIVLAAVKPSNRLELGLVIVAALLVRGGFALARCDNLSSDPDAYRGIAVATAQSGVLGLVGGDGEVVPTAFRPPLYPWLLSWFTHDGALGNAVVAMLHVGWGVLTVVLTYLTGLRLLGRPGIVAAGLVIVDPILLEQSTQVMTETLATVLAAAVCWWWTSDRSRLSPLAFAAVLGGLLACAYLCRPTFLVWAAMLTVAVLFHVPGRISHRMMAGLLVAAPVAIAVLGWTARNIRAIGDPVWATSHGGYTLLLGNNPDFYDYLGRGAWLEAWDAEQFLRAYDHRYEGDPRTDAFWRQDWSVTRKPFPRGISEVEDDQLAYQAAVATISREPRTFVWSCLVRVGRLWSPIPHRSATTPVLIVVVTGIYYLGLYLLIGCGIWRQGRQLWATSWWPIWTLAITLSLVHAVYWSNLRMRAPIIPGMALLAAASLTRAREFSPGAAASDDDAASSTRA